MRFTRTTVQMFIASVIAVAIAVGAYGYFFFTIRATSSEAATIAENLSHESAREVRLRAVESAVSDTAEQRQELFGRLLGPDGVVGFIEQIERLAGEAGVALEITGVTVAELPDSASAGQQDLFEAVEMSTAATGEWTAVYHFLSLIETLPMPILVRRTLIQQEEEGGWRLTATLSVPKQK